MTVTERPASLATEVFMIALDDRTGRFTINERVLAVGLAGAQLLELLLLRRIRLRADQTVRVIEGPAPEDLHTHTVLDRMAVEQNTHRPDQRPTLLPLGTWLAYLAANAVEEVGGRLVTLRWLDRDEARFRGVRWMPHNPTRVAMVAAALSYQFGERGNPTLWDAALAAVIDAIGLADRVIRLDDPGSRQRLASLAAELDEPLATVVAVTRTAAAGTVMTHI